LDYVGVGERITLIFISEKEDGKVWAGFIWLRMASALVKGKAKGKVVPMLN
jgi:hypothetical protein